MYTSGITQFLKNKGIDVKVFFHGNCFGKCEIRDLQEYVSGGNDLFILEPTLLKTDELSRLFEYMLKENDVDPNLYTDIYIESHADIDGLWAEYFAKKLNAKHIALLLNERFSPPDKRYYEYGDFFWHLYNEHRLRGPGIYSILSQLKKEALYYAESWSVERDPIADVIDERISKLNKCTWNIAYVGRGKKEYVPEIIIQIGALASRYTNIDIQFIFVGDFSLHIGLINKVFEKLDNVKLSLIGNLIPIPRGLFDIVDVVIANSQTAFFCAHENVPVVTVNSDDYLSGGVLGYDISYGIINPKGEDCKTVCEVLSDVLVYKDYKRKHFELPEKQNLEDVYSMSIRSFEEMKEWSYFDVEYHCIKDRVIKREEFINELRQECNTWYSQLELNKGGVAVFGAGQNGQLCLEWMNHKGYEVSLLVDNNAEKWGKEIEGIRCYPPETLKEQTVDYIIISSSQYADSIFGQLKDDYGIEKKQCTTYRALLYGAILRSQFT